MMVAFLVRTTCIVREAFQIEQIGGITLLRYAVLPNVLGTYVACWVYCTTVGNERVLDILQ